MPHRKCMIALAAIVALTGSAFVADNASAAFLRPGLHGPSLYRPVDPRGGGALQPAFGTGHCWQPTPPPPSPPRVRVWGGCGPPLPNLNRIPGH